MEGRAGTVRDNDGALETGPLPQTQRLEELDALAGRAQLRTMPTSAIRE